MSNQNHELRTNYDKPLSTNSYLREISLEKSKSPKKPFIYQKSIVVFFASCSSLIMYLLRFNMSVSIVSIVEEKIDVPVLKNSSSLFNSTIDQDFQNSSSYIIESRNKYDWDEVTQGQILASYFYGYTIFQVPCGRLSEKFGAKWVIGLGTFIPGILTFITPLIVDLGFIYTSVVRFFIGGLHAAVLCSCYTLISCWIPEKEKATSIVWIHISYDIGGMITVFLSGYICSNQNLGWQYSFYLLSIAAFIWFIPFIFLIYSEPNQNPRLTKYEKKLLEQSKAIEISKNDFSTKIVKVPPKLDIKKILTSRPVWAVCISKFTTNFGYYLITTKMPTYLKEVFQISVSKNGFFSSLTYIGSITAKVICLKLVDFLIRKKIMSTTNTRKFFQSLSMLIPAFSMLIITMKNDDKNLAIFLMIFSMFGIGFGSAGDSSMISEFSGDLSGTIFGFANMFACFDGFIAPIFVGIVMQNCDNVYFGWNIVFYVSFFLYIVGCLFFLIFASSELQPWAVTKYEEVNITNNKTKIKTVG